MPNVSPNIKGRGGGGGMKGRSKLTVNKRSIKRASNTKEIECNFCSHGSQDEKGFGKLHTLENVSAHYNCLLFSSGLGQNGEEEEGIEGFFLDDIKKEIRRSTKLKCCYCRQNGASIGCLERRCKRSYHFLCGLNAYALFQFTGNFCSYCVDHRPFQEGVNRGKEVECPICMEELIADPKIAVWAACCKKDDWFHKECVQNMANSAGYFFKCPLCNDKDTFTESMQLSGIHIPEQDAVWESEPNAFSDLYERRIHCDAPVCKCPEGRKLDDLGSRWEILLCDLCGTTGVHIVCGRLAFTCTKWNCSSCLDMLEESSKRSSNEVRQRRLNERQERTSIEKSNSRSVGRKSLNLTISESNPSRTNTSPIAPRGKGKGGRSGRHSLNVTIAAISPSRIIITSPSTRGRGKGKAGGRLSLNATNISPSRTLIASPSTQRGRGKRKTGVRQSLNVITADSSPSRTVINLPSTPKRRRTSESLVLPRKIARMENTPIKELKRALLTPNKEPFVELERIKIKPISVSENIDVDVEIEDKVCGVSRSLTKLMECETTATSSHIKCREITSFGANKSNESELNCDIIPSDTLEISDLEFKNVIKGKDVDENENSSISVVDEKENSSNSVSKKIVPYINEEKIQGLSTDDNIRIIEESGGELSESAIELKNYALIAQEIMNELQLTEAEIFNLASNSISRGTFAKSDISRFFRYNLTIKKMKEIRNIMESVFAERKAIIKSAQDSSRKKKSKSVSPKISKSDSLSYSTPKEKDVISELRSRHSSENINETPSVSTKEPVSSKKNSIKIKSSVGVLVSDKSKSSTSCDNVRGLEELEKKTEKIPTESPKKVDKLLIKMRSSPRKHLKTPPANVLFSKTGETTVTTTTTTPEETRNLSNSIMEVSCGIPNEQSTIDKLTTTSPRNSFGSPSLTGSPRKVPKSRIASPEKIAQGCILMWDEDFDESTDVPSKNDGDDLQKYSADETSIVDNTYQEEQMHDSVVDPSSEIGNVLSDSRVQCDEQLVPLNKPDSTISTESVVNIENKENSNTAISQNVDENGDNTCQEEQLYSSTSDLAKKTSNNNLADTRIQCIEKIVPISNQDCTVVNECILDGENKTNLDISISLNKKDKLLTSPSNNSMNDNNAHQEEGQHSSTESPTSETINNIASDTSVQCIEQLDTVCKLNSTVMEESLGNLENIEKSTSAISYVRDTSIDQSERYVDGVDIKKIESVNAGNTSQGHSGVPNRDLLKSTSRPTCSLIITSAIDSSKIRKKPTSKMVPQGNASTLENRQDILENNEDELETIQVGLNSYVKLSEESCTTNMFSCITRNRDLANALPSANHSSIELIDKVYLNKFLVKCMQCIELCEEVKRLSKSCHHVFCKNCISKSLHSAAFCPVCLKPVTVLEDKQTSAKHHSYSRELNYSSALKNNQQIAEENLICNTLTEYIPDPNTLDFNSEVETSDSEESMPQSLGEEDEICLTIRYIPYYIIKKLENLEIEDNKNLKDDDDDNEDDIDDDMICLRCPAQLQVGHLKKLIQQKYEFKLNPILELRIDSCPLRPDKKLIELCTTSSFESGNLDLKYNLAPSQDLIAIILKNNNSQSSTSNQNGSRWELKCPAAIQVSHLKKFVCFKYKIPNIQYVEFMYDSEVIHDNLNLQDIVHMFKWSSESSLPLLYTFDREHSLIKDHKPARNVIVAEPSDYQTISTSRSVVGSVEGNLVNVSLIPPTFATQSAAPGLGLPVGQMVAPAAQINYIIPTSSQVVQQVLPPATPLCMTSQTTAEEAEQVLSPVALAVQGSSVPAAAALPINSQLVPQLLSTSIAPSQMITQFIPAEASHVIPEASHIIPEASHIIPAASTASQVMTPPFNWTQYPSGNVGVPMSPQENHLHKLMQFSNKTTPNQPSFVSDMNSRISEISRNCGNGNMSAVFHPSNSMYTKPFENPVVQVSGMPSQIQVSGMPNHIVSQPNYLFTSNANPMDTAIHNLYVNPLEAENIIASPNYNNNMNQVISATNNILYTPRISNMPPNFTPPRYLSSSPRNIYMENHSPFRSMRPRYPVSTPPRLQNPHFSSAINSNDLTYYVRKIADPVNQNYSMPAYSAPNVTYENLRNYNSNELYNRTSNFVGSSTFERSNSHLYGIDTKTNGSYVDSPNRSNFPNTKVKRFNTNLSKSNHSQPKYSTPTSSFETQGNLDNTYSVTVNSNFIDTDDKSQIPHKIITPPLSEFNSLDEDVVDNSQTQRGNMDHTPNSGQITNDDQLQINLNDHRNSEVEINPIKPHTHPSQSKSFAFVSYDLSSKDPCNSNKDNNVSKNIQENYKINDNSQCPTNIEHSKNMHHENNIVASIDETDTNPKKVTNNIEKQRQTAFTREKNSDVFNEIDSSISIQNEPVKLKSNFLKENNVILQNREKHDMFNIKESGRNLPKNLENNSKSTLQIQNPSEHIKSKSKGLSKLSPNQSRKSRKDIIDTIIKSGKSPKNLESKEVSYDKDINLCNNFGTDSIKSPKNSTLEDNLSNNKNDDFNVSGSNRGDSRGQWIVRLSRLNKSNPENNDKEEHNFTEDQEDI